MRCSFIVFSWGWLFLRSDFPFLFFCRTQTKSCPTLASHAPPFEVEGSAVSQALCELGNQVAAGQLTAAYVGGSDALKTVEDTGKGKHVNWDHPPQNTWWFPATWFLCFLDLLVGLVVGLPFNPLEVKLFAEMICFAIIQRIFKDEHCLSCSWAMLCFWNKHLQEEPLFLSFAVDLCC